MRHVSLVLCLLLIQYSEANTVHTPRESFDKLLMSIQDSLPALSSYLDISDKSGQKATVASTGRRRTVTDLDCDFATGDIDSIEAICDEVRFNVLSSLIPNMTNIRTVNTSITDKFNSLSDEFFLSGKPERNPAKLMKDIYRLKVMTYGGLDFETNKTDPGLVVRTYENTQELLELHSLMEASLDTVWSNVDITQQAVAERLYNQVFVVATATEKFIDTLQEKSKQIMGMYTDLLRSDILQVNTDLLNITSSICEKQDKINAGGKQLIQAADELPKLSDKVDQLIDKYESIIEKFADSIGESDNVIEDMEARAESIASFGLDSIETYIENFADTFSRSLEQFLDKFFASQRSQQDTAFDQMSNIAINQTNDVLSLIKERKEKSQAIRERLADNLDKVKRFISGQITAVSNARDGKLGSVASSISAVSANASLAASQFSSSQRAIDSNFQSVETKVNSTLSNAAGDLSDLIQKASQEAGNKFSSGLSSLNSLQQKFGSSLGQQQLASQASVAHSDDSSAGSLFQTSQTVDDQVRLIATNNLLNDAKMETVSDQSTALLNTNMNPLFDTVGLLGDNLVGLSTQISNGRNLAKSHIRDTKSALDEADVDSILAASATVDASASESHSDLAREIGNSVSNAQLVSSNLTSSLSSLVKSQSDAYEVDSKLNSARNDEAGLSQIASDMDAIDSGTADGFESKFGDAKKFADSEMVIAAETAQNSLNKKQGAVNSKLSEIFSSLSDNLHRGGADFGGSKMAKETLRRIAFIEKGMANLTKVEDEIVKKFQSAISEHAVSSEAKFPGFMKQKQEQVKALLNAIKSGINGNITSISKHFESQVGKILRQYDIGGLSGEFESELDRLKDDMVPIEAVLNETIGGFVSAIPQVYGPFADETSEVVSEEERRLNEEIRDMEHDLMEKISNMTSAFNGRIRTITDRVDGAMSTASDSWKNATEDLNRMESLDANGTSKMYQIGSSESDATGNLLSRLESLLTGAMARKRSTASFSGELDSVSNLSSTLSSIVSDTSGGKFAATSALSDVSVSASNLVSNLESVSNQSLRNLNTTLHQESEQSQFGLDSSSGTLGRLAGMSLGSVNSTTGAVADSVSALNLATESGQTFLKNQKFSLASLDQQIGSNNGIATGYIDNSVSSLQSDIRESSQLYSLQMSQVKKFIKNTYEAWMKYMDYEESKFNKMANNDKVSLMYFENAVTNGLSDGRNVVNTTTATLANLTSTLAEEKLKLADFLDNLSSERVKEEEKIQTLVNETSIGATNVSDLIISLNKSATEAWATKQISIESSLSSFYSSLDKLESQMMTD